jgi:hypothetical protein
MDVRMTVQDPMQTTPALEDLLLPQVFVLASRQTPLLQDQLVLATLGSKSMVPFAHQSVEMV